MESTLEKAVVQVRAGTCVEDVARDLLDALLPEERLSLLDGDTDFWPGLLEMLPEGYNLGVIVAGRMSRVPWNFGGGPLMVRPR